VGKYGHTRIRDLTKYLGSAYKTSTYRAVLVLGALNEGRVRDQRKPTGELGEEGRRVQEGGQEHDVTASNSVNVVDEEIGETIFKVLPLDLAREEEGLVAGQLKDLLGQLLHLRAMEEHDLLPKGERNMSTLRRHLPTFPQPLHSSSSLELF
jgi:hypothetical protein